MESIFIKYNDLVQKETLEVVFLLFVGYTVDCFVITVDRFITVC